MKHFKGRTRVSIDKLAVSDGWGGSVGALPAARERKGREVRCRRRIFSIDPGVPEMFSPLT
jgi:hypothetical protein